MASPYNFNRHEALPANQHVHQPSNNTAFPDSNNALPSGTFDGFGSVFTGEPDFVGGGDEAWNYQPDRLNTSSLGFGDQSTLYHNAYADSQGTHLQNAGFGTGPAFSNFHQIPLDPSLATPDNHNTTASPSAFPTSDNNIGGTIAPEVLQNCITPSNVKDETPASMGPSAAVPPPAMPCGIRAGQFLVISPDVVEHATNARPLTKFVSVGRAPCDYPITKSTIPAYAPRKSRNEIRQVLGKDNRATAFTFKKISKKAGASPRSFARKDATSRLSAPAAAHGGPASSSEDESSDSSSEYESSDDEVAQAPLPSTRPAAPLEATHYDAVKALWRPPGRPLDNTSIRDGVSKFWELVSTIRNRWKSDSEEVKKAKDASKFSDVPLLEERVDKQREMLQIALKAANEIGHAEIIEQYFGINIQFLVLLNQFLTDRARVGDYNGNLPRTILELLSCCKSLSHGDLEKTSLGRVLQRFAKRGDEKSRSLVKKVIDNSVAVSKKKMGSSKASGAIVPQALENQNHSVPSAVGTKRRTSDATTSQPVKKIATSVSSSNSVDAAANATKKSVPNATSSKLGISNPTSTGIKQKITQVQAKPSGMFSLLKSAKKPKIPSTTTPSAEKPASSLSDSTYTTGFVTKDIEQGANATQGQAATIPKSSVPTAVPKQSSSFAQAMAAITGVEPPEQDVKSGTKRPLESEEESRKRRRKEARRHLHVSFKSDSELVEIHEFQHDPDEELGHDASQTRDVRDTKGEGRMFSHMFKIKSRDGDVEDEDQINSLDDHDKPLKAVSAVDFSVLAEDLDGVMTGDPRSANYERYGGFLHPECPERDIQQAREETTLVEVYTKSSSIPPSPKEPSQESTQDSPAPKPFGSVPEDLASRFKSTNKMAQAADASDHNLPPSTKLAAMLERLDAGQQQFTPRDQMFPNSMPDLTAILSQLSAPNQQQPMPPFNFNASVANQSTLPTSNTDLSAILASMRQPNQNEPSQGSKQEFTSQSYGQDFNQPLGQSFPQVPQSQNPGTSGTQTADLSAMLASLAQQGQSQNQNQNSNSMQQQLPFQIPQQPFPMQQSQFPMPQMPPMPLPPVPQNPEAERALQQQWQMMLQQGQNPFAMNPFQPQSIGSSIENTDRRERRKGDDAEDVNGYKKRFGGGWKPNKGTRDRSPPKFVLPCKYWSSGRCQKGDKCTYRHDGPQQT